MPTLRLQNGATVIWSDPEKSRRSLQAGRLVARKMWVVSAEDEAFESLSLPKNIVGESASSQH
jgi:hypothetical protein